MGEFDLIQRFFAEKTQRLQTLEQRTGHASHVIKGIGDDCAVLAPDAGMQLAISSDMLVEGRHFLPGCDAARLGHKALAVNLSDLAAAGAEPLGFTLAMALPEIDAAWLDAFSDGMLALAGQFHCPLVGGDTTRGPMNFCITVFGQVPAGQALLRSGAKPGDDIYVSGSVGEARLALDVLLGKHQIDNLELRQYLLKRIEAPTPRLALGQALRGIASSAIDLSDGLMGDLGHILKASGVGALLQADAVRETSRIWKDAQLRAWPREQRNFYGLAGGDDYELAFTAPVSARADVVQASQGSQTPVHRIGTVVAKPGLALLDAEGQPMPVQIESFDHFKAS